jgi:hypothetical protein
MAAIGGFRMLGDPPPAGGAKLRIRGNGDPHETRVFVVDDLGVERELVGVVRVSFVCEPCPNPREGYTQSALIEVLEVEVDTAVEDATVKLLPLEHREDGGPS